MEHAHRSASPLTPMSLATEYASQPSGLRSSVSAEHEDDHSGEDLSWALHNDMHEEDMDTPMPKPASERALAL